MQSWLSLVMPGSTLTVPGGATMVHSSSTNDVTKLDTHKQLNQNDVSTRGSSANDVTNLVYEQPVTKLDTHKQLNPNDVITRGSSVNDVTNLVYRQPITLLDGTSRNNYRVNDVTALLHRKLFTSLGVGLLTGSASELNTLGSSAAVVKQSPAFEDTGSARDLRHPARVEQSEVPQRASSADPQSDLEGWLAPSTVRSRAYTADSTTPLMSNLTSTLRHVLLRRPLHVSDRDIQMVAPTDM